MMSSLTASLQEAERLGSGESFRKGKRPVMEGTERQYWSSIQVRGFTV